MGTASKTLVAMWSLTTFFLTLPIHRAHAEALPPPEITTFSNWVAQYRADIHRNSQAAIVAEGVTAARQRRILLKSLIESDPRTALAFSRSVTNPTDLPLEIQRELETPFATRGDFIVQGAVAAQGGPEVESIRRFVRLGHRRRVYHAHVFWATPRRRQSTGCAVERHRFGRCSSTGRNPVPLLKPRGPTPPTAHRTTGGKNVLIIRVDFSDLTGAPEGYSAATVQNIADTQIAPYYAQKLLRPYSR